MNRKFRPTWVAGAFLAAFLGASCSTQALVPRIDVVMLSETKLRRQGFNDTVFERSIHDKVNPSSFQLALGGDFELFSTSLVTLDAGYDFAFTNFDEQTRILDVPENPQGVEQRVLFQKTVAVQSQALVQANFRFPRLGGELWGLRVAFGRMAVEGVAKFDPSGSFGFTEPPLQHFDEEEFGFGFAFFVGRRVFPTGFDLSFFQGGRIRVLRATFKIPLCAFSGDCPFNEHKPAAGVSPPPPPPPLPPP